MPNSPDVNRTILGLRIDRTLKLQLERKARELGITVSALCNRILIEETADVELTPEDYRQIAEDIEKAKKRRKQ